MRPIQLFLPTFRSFIRSGKFNSEGDKLPVFYYEEDTEIWFYKIVEGILFYTKISKLPEILASLPKNITIDILKRNEFQAEEIPEQLIKPNIISGTID